MRPQSPAASFSCHASYKRAEKIFGVAGQIRLSFEPAPTKDLFDWLRKRIVLRDTIVVQSPTGQLADALGVPGINAYAAEDDRIKDTGGCKIERMDALEALLKHRPKTVIACGELPLATVCDEDGFVRTKGLCDLEIALHCESLIYFGPSTLEGNGHMSHRLLFHRPSSVLLNKPWLLGNHQGEPGFIATWDRESLLRQTERRSDWTPYLCFASEYVFAKHLAQRRIPERFRNEAGFRYVRDALFRAAERSDNGRQALVWLLHATVPELDGATPLEAIWANRIGDVLSHLSRSEVLSPTDGETSSQATIALGLLRANPPIPLQSLSST